MPGLACLDELLYRFSPSPVADRNTRAKREKSESNHGNTEGKLERMREQNGAEGSWV